MYRKFHITAQLAGKPLYLHFLRFLGRVGQVLRDADLRGIDRRLNAEETEKVEVQRLAGELGGDMELAIRQLAEGKR